MRGQDALQKEMQAVSEQVETALTAYLAIDDDGAIGDSMRYSLLGGGKRVRPFLVLSFAELFAEEGKKEAVKAAALPFACALEMIHSYSLIHDDLPCMDDDDLRRGKPSNHKVFGEAGAVLAGDGLLTLAFETAAQNQHLPPEMVLQGIRILAHYAGYLGMVGGQVLDSANEKNIVPMTAEQLDRINDLKTGALIKAACLLGALAAMADASQTAAAECYAEHLGRAFQLTDDLLDVTGSAAALGKTTGKDEAHGKITYPALLGMEACRAKAEAMVNAAADAVRPYPGSETLIALAEYLLLRTT